MCNILILLCYFLIESPSIIYAFFLWLGSPCGVTHVCPLTSVSLAHVCLFSLTPYILNITVLPLFMIYIILYSYTYVFLVILSLLRTLLPNSKLLFFYVIVFHPSVLSTISSLEKSPWSLGSSHVILFFMLIKMCLFISVRYNFGIPLLPPVTLWAPREHISFSPAPKHSLNTTCYSFFFLHYFQCFVLDSNGTCNLLTRFDSPLLWNSIQIISTVLQNTHQEEITVTS